MQATPRDLRLGRTKKCNLAALLAVVVILTAGNRAPAADTIEELLQQDEASGQNELRPDLNALTEAEWEYYFNVVKHSDTQLDSQLVERESETPRRVIYIWAPAAIAAGFGMAICAIMLALHAPRSENPHGPGPNGGPKLHHRSLRRARRRTALMAAVLRSHPGDRML